ncbi:hypothetical protein N0V84_009221 [Fusarium piperis]|uniref:Regulator of chromosome condensation n=1 Tax=Fusarium piperis TaxID=1435070 RepID=A0A9W8W6Q7_9HYPO|nr:hypothetical protein N0V84_009221 [Fusarium piperis]
MELYATGFNAWNQLIFDPSAVKDEPDDIFSFTKILGAQRLDRVVSQMCYTAGREVDEPSPADVPGLVSDLSDIGEPIKKVVAGGYTLAALTEGGGLYLWGMQSPGSQSRHQAFTDLSGIPNYVEVDGEKDVQDIALGESHAIALTTDGCVYVVGDNTNGQLGLGSDSKGPVESWLKMTFTPPTDWEIVGVEAGPRSSFIVTAKAKPN